MIKYGDCRSRFKMNALSSQKACHFSRFLLITMKSSATDSLLQFPPIALAKPATSPPAIISKIMRNKSTPKMTHDDKVTDTIRLIFDHSECHVLQ